MLLSASLKAKKCLGKAVEMNGHDREAVVFIDLLAQRAVVIETATTYCSHNLRLLSVVYPISFSVISNLTAPQEPHGMTLL